MARPALFWRIRGCRAWGSGLPSRCAGHAAGGAASPSRAEPALGFFRMRGSSRREWGRRFPCRLHRVARQRWSAESFPAERGLFWASFECGPPYAAKEAEGFHGDFHFKVVRGDGRGFSFRRGLWRGEGTFVSKGAAEMREAFHFGAAGEDERGLSFRRRRRGGAGGAPEKEGAAAAGVCYNIRWIEIEKGGPASVMAAAGKGTFQRFQRFEDHGRDRDGRPSCIGRIGPSGGMLLPMGNKKGIWNNGFE